MEILWNCNPLKKTSDKKKSGESIIFTAIYICAFKGQKKIFKIFYNIRLTFIR